MQDVTAVSNKTRRTEIACPVCAGWPFPRRHCPESHVGVRRHRRSSSEPRRVVHRPLGRGRRQAGAHPDVRFSWTVPTIDPDDPWGPLAEQPHRILVDTPPGLVGDPTAAPHCPERLLKAGPNGNSARCPVGAQVGYADVNWWPLPVFNIEPPEGTPGLFAFNVPRGSRAPDADCARRRLRCDGRQRNHLARAADSPCGRNPLGRPGRSRQRPPARQRQRPQLLLSRRPRARPRGVRSCRCRPRVRYAGLTITARLDGWDSIGEFATRVAHQRSRRCAVHDGGL